MKYYVHFIYQLCSDHLAGWVDLEVELLELFCLIDTKIGKFATYNFPFHRQSILDPLYYWATNSGKTLLGKILYTLYNTIKYNFIVLDREYIMHYTQQSVAELQLITSLLKVHALIM